jgi:translation initiation factor 4E
MYICLQLLCLIGEAFEDLGDEICGAVINLRPKGDKLGLWTSDASHAEAVMKIGSVNTYLLVQ